MTEKQYIEWCGICKNRAEFGGSILCSLTNENANFKTECLSFDIDRKRALNKDYYCILSKYEGNSRSKVKPTELKKIWTLLDRKPLPNIFIIRKSNLLPFYILGVLSGIFTFIIGIEFYKKNNVDSFYVFMLFIGAAIAAIFIYKSILYKRSNEPIIQITNEGLQIQNSTFYNWEKIQTFQLIEYGRFRYDSLIVKPIMGNEIIQELSILEYSPNHIIHLIEKYKNLP
ncbi:MAG: hypothetical protein RIQ59_1554 [Bacteroidota bacterium]|jgi:hypothetical protein